MHLFVIICIIGVIILGIEAIAKLFRQEKANKYKKEELKAQLDSAFETHSQNLDELGNKYNKLYSEFCEYKQESQAALAEMEKYTDKVIDLSNRIMAFDNDFDEKLILWCKMLNNADNTEKVREQIKKHIELDIKFKNDLRLEQEQRQAEIQNIIRKNLGLGQ